MAHVIKTWYARNTPNAEGNDVHLVGREAGLLAWLLSVVGLDPTTEVMISDRLIVFTSASLSGRTTRVMPLQALTSAFYGYEKPWKEALVLTALLAPVLIGFLVGRIYYFLNKTLTIGVVESSGWSGGFAFKRSVIEGRNIDENNAYLVIDIVRSLVEKRTA